jgi:hypothetical protein
MEKKFSEGTMGAAEQKNQKYWVPGLAVLILISYLFFWFPLFNTFPHDWFVKAGTFTNVIATLSCILHLGVFIWQIKKIWFEANSLPGKLIALFLVWTGLNWGLLAGFNAPL